MIKVEISPVRYQSLGVTVNKQNCTIILRQMGDYLYFSLYFDNKPIVENVICLDRVKLVRYEYLGFIGDFVFGDTQGTSDPTYGELGTRFILAYLDGTE